MVFKDYLDAAKRYNYTCQYLLQDYENVYQVAAQKKLLQSVYYLSGYIIECTISWKLFDIINYSHELSVYQLDNNNQFQYKFNTLFRDHSYLENENRLNEIIARGGQIPSNAPLIGEEQVTEVLMKMYREWDTQARYSNRHLTFDLNVVHVREFFNLCERLYSIIRKIGQ